MRHRLLLVLLLAMLLVSGGCRAANRTPITLRARNTSVQPVLRTLLDRAGFSYVVGADVPDDYLRSVSIVNVPLDVALSSLSRSWKLTCTFEDGLCSIRGLDTTFRDLRSAELHSDPETPANASFRDFRSAELRSNPETPAPGEGREKNDYYLVRNSAGSGRSGASYRVSLGPREVRNDRLDAALIAYADTVSRLVTPEALDDLALRLSHQVDEKPYLQQRLASEQIGLTQFRSINIQSRVVAVNVAEDLSTSMIRAGFHLVERAQLDQACAELHLQDTALIDPATANRLGQMTGCGVIVVGSISDRGDLVVINARLVETATGKALAADRVTISR